MKKLMLGAMLTAMVMTAQAEPLRTMFTTENQLPEKGQWESGAWVQSSQRQTTEAVYGRYGLFGNLAASAFAPFKQIKNTFGGNQSGFGDVGLGFQLLAYEDIFRYPYIMPHLEIQLPTGDEGKGLGAGEVSFLGGVTVGTKTWECVDWAVDVTGAHRVISKTQLTRDFELKDDTVTVSGSIVWSLDEKFALVAEVSGSDQIYTDGKPLTFEGGMVYKPIENLMFGLYGGTTSHSGESGNGAFRMSYSF